MVKKKCITCGKEVVTTYNNEKPKCQACLLTKFKFKQ